MAFLANPTARFRQYVDTATGSASGPGAADTPWATIDQAIAAVPTTCTAVGGATGTAILGGTTGSPQTHVSTAGIPTTATLTIEALNTWGAKLAGNGTSRVLSLATAGSSTTLRGVIVDPSLNDGGAAADGIVISLTGTVLSLTLDTVKFQNWTGRAVKATGGSRINYTQTNCVFVGGSVPGAVYLAGTAAGTLTISGGSSTIASHVVSAGTTDANIYILGGTGTTATLSVANFSTSTTIDPASTGSGNHYGIRAFDIVTTVSGTSTHDVLGAYGSRQGHNLRVEALNNSISGSSIDGVTGSNTATGGIGFGIGSDTSGIPTVGTGCSISNASITGNSDSMNGGLHGIFLGCLANSSAINFTAVDCGLPFVDKGTTGTTASGFTITGFKSAGIRSKASTNATYTAGTVTQSSGYSSGILIDATRDVATSTDTTGLSFSGLTLNNNGTGSYFIKKTASDTLTSASNVYNQVSGSLNANAVDLGSATYGTLAAWQAVEPTATGTGW